MLSSCDDTGASTPMVISTTPDDRASGVQVGATLTAVFSEGMDADTIDGATFSLTTGPRATEIGGTVSYAGTTAFFSPEAELVGERSDTATITTAAQSASGTALAQSSAWTFTTGAATLPGIPVQLGAAGTFAILAKSGVTSVPPSNVSGDIGVSPIASGALTGFTLVMDPSLAFSTSAQVTGRVFAMTSGRVPRLTEGDMYVSAA